ncbi:MAG: ABC transporter permease [Lentisphaerae bacterium]|nr:ABC transporter permease [Lentisphaerota bacterium]
MKLIHDIWERRDAIKQLVLKNYRVRYRNMALGVLWSVLNPLIMLGVLAFVFTHVYPQAGNIPYFPLFLLIGLVHFNSFTRNMPGVSLSVLEHASLLKKVAFPRLIIPLAMVLAQLTDFAVLLGLLMVFTLGFGLPITLHIFWLLAAVLVQTIFTAGLGFLCSALNVYYRDTLYIIESGLTILFWLTPVFYPLEFIRTRLPPVVYDLYLLNPMAGCIETSRRAILLQSNPDWRPALTALAVSIATLCFGVFTFQRLQRRFADFT